MKEKNREEVPVESKEQVERIKEILPHCTEREIYEALKDGKMDSNDAAQRLLSQGETEKNREAVPMEGKEKVERIKKMVPRFAEELICEVLEQCNMDSNLAIRRLLAQETGNYRERSPMEWKEQFECIKEMVPRFTKEDREGVPMEWKEQVERIKEMMSCFTEETIYKMLEQCYIDPDLTLPRLLSPETPSNSGSPLTTFSSPPSSAKSSVASQLHSVSSDKGKEVVRHTEDDAATMSRSNVRALRAKGPWSSHAVQAGSNPMSLGHNVASFSRNDLGYNEALGSSEFLAYKLFPPPTQQYGISFTLSDLVANTYQPSELPRLPRFPFLDNPSVPSKSSAAGSQHPQTSTSEWRQRKQRGCTNGGEGESVKFCKTAVNCERMLPRFADELIYKVLEQCNMDSNLAIQRLLSQETRKNRERPFMELTEQVERIKEMVPPFAEVDGEGVPMEWKQQVERVKEMVPCFTEEMICKMHEQCNIDSEPETPSNSGSPSSSAKSSVASQLQSVSLDRAKEVACRTEDDAAPTSRSNVRASCAKVPRSSHASQAGSDPVAIRHKASLGSSDFLEYKLFPPPTQPYGKSFMPNDLVANANQPSELRRLLRSPFLDTPSEPSRSSAAGSQHPQTSTSESGRTEATPTSPAQPFRDPQDPVLDAPFGVSRYGPIQRPKRMSESGRSEATTGNLPKCSIQSTRRNSTGLASSRFHHADAHSVSNAQPFTASASIHGSPETLSLGNNMSACCGFARPYIVPSFYQPLWPLQQHGYMDGGHNMHRNLGYDMPSAQQEVRQAGRLSRANADASAWGSYPGAGSAPPGSLTISPAPSDISRSGHDFALHAQAQHQLRTDYHPAEVNYSYAEWNHQPDSGAMSALPELQLGSFPGWAPLPPRANNQRAEGCSQRYAYRGCSSGQLPETSVMPKHE